jgi:ATP synthase protein I
LSDEELEALAKQIASIRNIENSANEEPARRDESGASVAINMAAELLATVLVGGALGYLLDDYFGFTPFGLVIGLFLGMVAGIIGIKKINDNYQKNLQESENDAK